MFEIICWAKLNPFCSRIQFSFVIFLDCVFSRNFSELRFEGYITIFVIKKHVQLIEIMKLIQQFNNSLLNVSQKSHF